MDGVPLVPAGLPLLLNQKLKMIGPISLLIPLVNSALVLSSATKESLSVTQFSSFSFSLRYRTAPDNMRFSFILSVTSPREVVVPGPGDQTFQVGGNASYIDETKYVLLRILIKSFIFTESYLH